ncbi:chemotaxis protein MotB [Thiomicrorhabdus immobilis]|uniref:Chemotaxis protein MotB n=1 Tax=Thiomicrorhabdus immobilis TaxID=2791037 RepID=A0ABN6CXP1_9GAMM|nr:flagellar motor protein MotB [Thiomicrorhabdus immobilis]BCN92637.1 chemotaxis protein MotB [Thiomicrorhabdus immobilis]
MNVVMERAKSAWLLAFGDVITLLITFFIMAIALNKGEISKVQRWVDDQVTESYQVLADEIKQQNLQVIKVNRTARGVLLSIQSDNAFESGSFRPTEQLSQELETLGKVLKKTPLLNILQSEDNRQVIGRAKEDGMQWYSEIRVEGHTDNDPINPLSRLRNNYFLSTLRAESVMQTLYRASELPAQLFSVSGYGEWQTIADNGTDDGKRQNRRVEVLISASFQKIN